MTVHLSNELQSPVSAVDARGMRNLLLGGVVLVFELLLLAGFLALSLAARTALAIAPNR
jgi:hypothetical protein